MTRASRAGRWRRHVIAPTGRLARMTCRAPPPPRACPCMQPNPQQRSGYGRKRRETLVALARTLP